MSDIGATDGSLVLPPVRLYAEADDDPDNWARRLISAAGGVYTAWLRRRFRSKDRALVLAVAGHRAYFAALDESRFAEAVVTVRDQLRREKFRDEIVARCFAMIREAARRTIGQTHYDVQIVGGYALLNGMMAELETGEGKTLTATLAAATAALAGVPVHVITVNDYLAARDRDLMAPVYQALGLTVGVVVGGLGSDQRRQAYACDITYGTNKEVAFDYLRDRMMLGNAPANLKMKLERLHTDRPVADAVVMRGLHFAIVDEADSVLIDDARTPLIISAQTDPDDERQHAEDGLRLVEAFRQDVDFVIRRDDRSIELTEVGRDRLADRARGLAGPWHGAVFREAQARNGLTALHLFERDRHYLVRDDKVEIIDENTGRVMPDRSWADGLHQLIQSKETCTVTGRTRTVARMTYQRFFRRYRRLAGMTGTAREARGELWNVYRLPFRAIATNKPLRRDYPPPMLVRTNQAKWAEIVRRTIALHGDNIPVLIGTRTVAASEAASAALRDAGIAHAVLSAAQDAHEAEIIAKAGQPGRVTVATNMAGRGVDIKLGRGVEQRGGLHVIMSELHDSGRIDRQLFGRCARQGEQGRVEVVLSGEDALVNEAAPRLLHLAWRSPRAIRMRAMSLVFGYAQSRMERRFARVRLDLLRADQRLGTALAFTGQQE